MIADRIPAFHKLTQLVDSLKPRSLNARFAALSAPQRTMVILIAVLLTVVLTTFNRYGFTPDEFRGVSRAREVLGFLGFHGKSLKPSGIDMSHGTAPDVLALVLQTLVPPLSYDSRHLVFALFGVAGIYYVYRFGSKFVGEWIGVFAALFLAITPLWFGHMFINAKDIPFATLLLASSYYSLLILTGSETSRGLWLRTGLAIGLLAATKFVGLLALVFVVAVYLACLATLPNQNKVQLAPDLGRRIASLALAGLLGCLLCFLLFWPQFYVFDIVFREAGKRVLSVGKDPYYASTYFIVSTPLFLLGLAVAGVVFALYRREAAVIAAIVVFFSFFLAQALTSVSVHDGCRQFLFVYPYFAIMAAYPVALVLDAARVPLARRTLMGAIFFCVTGTTLEMYRLFPFEYSFYNSLVGGFAGADGMYVIDTWRSADREALDLVAARVSPGNTVRILSCGSKLNVMIHPGFKLAEGKEDADYVIAGRKGEKCAPKRFEGLPVVGEVRREGVLLARVYALGASRVGIPRLLVHVRHQAQT